MRPPAGFADGQDGSANAGSMTTPDVYLAVVQPTKSISLDVSAVTATDSGGNGFIDPGEQVTLQVALRNYVTNPLNADNETNVTATLTTSTPGVTVLSGSSAYPKRIGAGATATNLSNFVLQISAGFVPGTRIDLTLHLTKSNGATKDLNFDLTTGTPSATTIYTENFDEVAPGTLPAGWSAVHAGGNNVVPWTTNNTFLGNGSNALFHQEAEDGLGGNSTRFERAFSPLINIPATSSYVTFDFDVKYNTEDDPNFNILAFDGFLLRITDQTPGRVLRSVLVDAFADAFTTGSVDGYVKHLPRSGNPNYFQDMSVWGGNSGGILHVHLVLPGMAGSTIQMRWEYTQDANGIAASGAPGVAVDNIVIQNVVLGAQGAAPAVSQAVASALAGPVQTPLSAGQPAVADLDAEPEEVVSDAIQTIDQAFLQHMASLPPEPHLTPKPLAEVIDLFLMNNLGLGGDDLEQIV
jgi:hypothetical protein